MDGAVRFKGALLPKTSGFLFISLFSTPINVVFFYDISKIQDNLFRYPACTPQEGARRPRSIGLLCRRRRLVETGLDRARRARTGMMHAGQGACMSWGHDAPEESGRTGDLDRNLETGSQAHRLGRLSGHSRGWSYGGPRRGYGLGR